jgi:transcriptional regulator with XRE-family HTH domain
LAAADAAMKTFEELLASRPNASKCREQRIASGLSLRKAAERLGLSGQQLSDLEWGRQPIDAVMEQKMVELYQLGGER